MGLISELRRRNVFRMAVLYVVAAWLIMQVTEVLMDLANLPNWIGPATLALLALGLPISLVLSWFFELTPQGISPERDVEPGESITQVSGRRLDFIVISMLCAAIILFAYDKWWTGPSPGNSIAVLPFVNTSGDQQNDYLSDGLSEDTLNILARLANLHVVSRSSSFIMKPGDVDIGQAADRLSVSHILTGSVRRSGEVVRVVARLVSARDGKQRWSETYEKDWGEAFGIPEKIASSVTRELGYDQSSLRSPNKQPDREAYDLYLRARYIAQARTPETLAKSVMLIKESIDIDPLFAEGRGFLATLYFLQKAYSATTAEEADSLFDLAEHTAVQALVLDENLPGPRAILAVRALYRHEWQLAEENFKRAVAIAPNDSQVRRWYSRQLMWLGYLEEALLQAKAAQRLDPISAASNGNLGLVFAVLGEEAEAKKYAEISRELGLTYFYTSDIMVNLGSGRLADAAQSWTAGLAELGHDTATVAMLIEASERPELIPATLERLDALGQDAEPARELALALLLLRQYETYLSNVENDWFLVAWCPLAGPMRKLPSFQSMVTATGMLDYWSVRGWPDLCHATDDGFVCN